MRKQFRCRQNTKHPSLNSQPWSHRLLNKHFLSDLRQLHKPINTYISLLFPQPDKNASSGRQSDIVREMPIIPSSLPSSRLTCFQLVLPSEEPEAFGFAPARAGGRLGLGFGLRGSVPLYLDLFLLGAVPHITEVSPCPSVPPRGSLLVSRDTKSPTTCHLDTFSLLQRLPESHTVIPEHSPRYCHTHSESKSIRQSYTSRSCASLARSFLLIHTHTYTHFSAVHKLKTY